MTVTPTTPRKRPLSTSGPGNCAAHPGHAEEGEARRDRKMRDQIEKKEPQAIPGQRGQDPFDRMRQAVVIEGQRLTEWAKQTELLECYRMDEKTRAAWRKAIVGPRLEALGWSVYRWEKEAGVPSKLAQRYLDGKTKKLASSSRAKLSRALGIDLPL